ncbi:MAG: TraB/GumN family protein [Hyphomonadaceae bacterium]|jgi:uncharacterized protein YbaP (TraB family)|nr:TraB/GumN family protein [Hyphomonadaceae bacterium]
MRRLRRCLAVLFLLNVQAGAAQAQPPACTGKNVLEELRQTDQAAHARVMAASASTANAKAILWRLERAGAPPSHLFGTMHLSDERINALSPAVEQALAASRRLVLELEDVSPETFMQALAGSPQVAELMLFTDGRRLDQLLGPEDARQVAEALSRSGIPPGIGGMFRPWVATMLLSVSACERRRLAAGLLPLDARLAKAVQGRGIKTEGLETLDSQFRALASVPEPDQVEMLKSGIRFYHRIDDLMETMIQLYLQRELGAIWPLQIVLAEKVGARATAFDAAEQSLLVTRNLDMRDKLLALLAEGDAFIAVGGLHLPGRQGLVALLREAGYVVTPIE